MFLDHKSDTILCLERGQRGQALAHYHHLSLAQCSCSGLLCNCLLFSCKTYPCLQRYINFLVFFLLIFLVKYLGNFIFLNFVNLKSSVFFLLISSRFFVIIMFCILMFKVKSEYFTLIRVNFPKLCDNRLPTPKTWPGFVRPGMSGLFVRYKKNILNILLPYITLLFDILKKKSVCFQKQLQR